MDSAELLSKTFDAIDGAITAAEKRVEQLEADNARLREALEYINENSYPGLAVKESTLLNRIYRASNKALK